ncbi:MAG TPA: ATP-binding protein [Pyrinomonadaceae bacterium]|nr:ATP-binding protein [Pyrinomonadaceae bacterium]
MSQKLDSRSHPRHRGKLRIGNDWNAITIIALSQSNPLKAIAELVENSIDARATKVTIIRGRSEGSHYLEVRDNGQGIPRDADGRPDFRYVATHICDSMKRQLKREGAGGLQGEFGIGLLSFWTLGEELTLTSAGKDGRIWQMLMRKGDPSYSVKAKRQLFSEPGTQLRIARLLDGIRSLSGEKIQWYLAAELRDRIRHTGVRITVLDKISRKQYAVEPRQYEGRLLHQLPAVRATLGDIYVELYLNEPRETNRVALFRHGTRVFEDISAVDELAKPPWTTRYLQGHIDAPFINLTPGTRTGIIHDEAYAALLDALLPLEEKLIEILEAQRQAEEEQASRELLQTIQRAFREAFLALPAEEYDWFDIHSRAHRGSGRSTSDFDSGEELSGGAREPENSNGRQRQFFEFAGPLFSVAVSPASSVVRVGEQRSLRALPYDRSRRRVETDLTFLWEVVDGIGALDRTHDQAVSFLAPAEPGLVRVRVTVCQGDIGRSAEALITVTHELLPQVGTTMVESSGLPGYTFESAPGESWRSRFDAPRNVIVVNNGHRDFVYAGRNKSLKLRYLVRLYSKELVLKNFVGLPPDQLLERMVELSLRTEENL